MQQEIQQDNTDIFTGLAIAGVLGVAGYFIYTNFILISFGKKFRL